jgi:uncharacterized membrane protein affecting hemolysin expression
VCYTLPMTRLLKEALEKVSQLPQERQDELARMLIDTAASDLSPYMLSDQERTMIEHRLASQVYATDEEVAGMWKRWGL